MSAEGDSDRARTDPTRPSQPDDAVRPSLDVFREPSLEDEHAERPTDTAPVARPPCVVAVGGTKGGAGTSVAMLAGVPFGKSGATNLLHIVRLTGDELEGAPQE